MSREEFKFSFSLPSSITNYAVKEQVTESANLVYGFFQNAKAKNNVFFSSLKSKFNEVGKPAESNAVDGPSTSEKLSDLLNQTKDALSDSLSNGLKKIPNVQDLFPPIEPPTQYHCIEMEKIDLDELKYHK